MKTYYREVGDEARIFELCYRNRLPLLIKGPTGCGKSQFVAAMAERLGRPVVKVSCNEDTTAADLLGRFIIRSMETVWQDGPVTRAVREGAILYLDEIAEAREDVIVALHPLTDHRRELYLDRTNEILNAPDSFFCVASYNPGYQRGLKELKPSTRQRFVGVALSYPEPKIEAEIVQVVTEVKSDTAERLVKYAAKIRSLTQLGLRETVSTRLLIHAGRLIQAGMDARVACRVAIAEPLSDDPKVIGSIVDLGALHF
jgi:nitric oxide reductase NorQ protein